MSIEKG